MITARVAAGVVFVAAVLLGTLVDVPARASPLAPSVLIGDLHVHAFPADGIIPVWDVQREAARRGLDVVAITNHNRDFSVPLARATGLLRDYPIVIPSQELTAPAFHMAAIGVREMIDWRLSARAAIEKIHEQGGVAIAAHPVAISWRDNDPEALAVLDGAEVSHPMILESKQWGSELERFYTNARAVNPGIAPIGSSDYHGGAPLGICRTYLIVDEVSRAGVLDAIRGGRTVASGPGDRLIGDDANVRLVKKHLARRQPPGWGYSSSTWVALTAILALGALVVSGRGQ
ncbi:MAG: CehA/McbA family metallohydrolase [Acidobacteria bacterium]|nr:CehA/McbA family metallohydrolase [Acidobacteriota bacterium]